MVVSAHSGTPIHCNPDYGGSQRGPLLLDNLPIRSLWGYSKIDATQVCNNDAVKAYKALVLETTVFRSAAL